MSEYQFTLAISGNVDHDEVIDALFEAGCDDATFGTVDGVGYAGFAREAPSFGDAVASAIKQVESVAGLQVRRVEPDDLVTMAEIATPRPGGTTACSPGFQPGDAPRRPRPRSTGLKP